jgi:hypothetical protein
MADLNALYSYQGQEPRPLPHEISYTESWGATTFRQGVETFTDEEIAKAGYTGPFTKSEFDAEVETQAWSSEEQDWITTPIPDEFFWERLRAERDYKLAISDRTQLADAPLTSAKKTAWATYRQALRDLPANTENPREVTWPVQPE